MKANIPPFTVGQTVVYVGPSNNGYIQNKVYTITHIKKGCGCNGDGYLYDVSVGIPIPNGAANKCNNCGYDHQNNGFISLAERLHKPTQKMNAPLLTFEEIKEEEKEEVLIMN